VRKRQEKIYRYVKLKGQEGKMTRRVSGGKSQTDRLSGGKKIKERIASNAEEGKHRKEKRKFRSEKSRVSHFQGAEKMKWERLVLGFFVRPINGVGGGGNS